MSDDLVKRSIAELQDIVRCRCHPAYKDRGMHDPDCECDSAEAVQVVADRIEELEAKAMKAANAALLEKRRADAAEARVKELDAEIAKWRAAFIAQSRKLQGQTDDRSPPDS
jgi:hypothetical protein